MLTTLVHPDCWLLTSFGANPIIGILSSEKPYLFRLILWRCSIELSTVIFYIDTVTIYEITTNIFYRIVTRIENFFDSNQLFQLFSSEVKGGSSRWCVNGSNLNDWWTILSLWRDKIPEIFFSKIENKTKSPTDLLSTFEALLVKHGLANVKPENRNNIWIVLESKLNVRTHLKTIISSYRSILILI